MKQNKQLTAHVKKIGGKLYHSVTNPKLQIFGVLILALLLRLPLLDGSFWLDEAAQAIESSRPWSQQLSIAEDFQPPLLHLLLHVVVFQTGLPTSEWVLRVVGALIPGLITIWLTYALGKKWFNHQVGLLASILLATNSLHIYFSQELRPYSLPAALAIASWWVLEQIRTQSGTKWSWLFATYGFLTALGLYSSYLYPFLLIGQVVAVVVWWWQRMIRQEQLLPIASSWLLGIGMFLPWLPFLKTQLAVGSQLRQALPGWDQVVSFTQLKSLALVVGKFVYGVIDLKPSLLITASLLAMIVLITTSIFAVRKKAWAHLLQALKRSVRPQSSAGIFTLVIWLLAPLVSAWIVSFWIPVIQPKRVIYLLPAWCLLIAALSLLPAKRRLSKIMIALVMLLNLNGTWQYWTSPSLQRENWRGLHTEITRSYRPTQAVVVFSFPDAFAPWRWYGQGDFPSISTGKLHTSQVDDLTNVLKPITEKEYVLVFDYLRDLTDPANQVPQVIESFGYQQVGVIDYPNIGFVRVYARPTSIISLQIEKENR